MPCINIPIDPIGPVIEIGVSQPTSTANGTHPTVYWIKAVVDTGCSHTSIHTSVAVKCGLTVLGKASANTPGGAHAVNLYHGDLFLRPIIRGKPFEFPFNDRGLVEMTHQNPDFDALLGMDILNYGTFHTNGVLKQATFCW